MSKGCAREIPIARQAFLKGGSLALDGQNLAQVSWTVSYSLGRIRRYFCGELELWVKIPILSEALFPNLSRCDSFG